MTTKPREIDANHLVLITDYQTDALKKFAEASRALNDALLPVHSIDPALITPLADILFQLATLSGGVALRAAQCLREPPSPRKMCGCAFDCPYCDQQRAEAFDEGVDQ